MHVRHRSRPRRRRFGLRPQGRSRRCCRAARSSRSSAPRETASEALELVEELQPDVITCDLIMPVLDGVGFIREQMARRPMPIVVVSVASESGELVLGALDAGAVDFVQKPTALATDRVLEIADELIEKVKAAAGAHVGRRHAPLPRRPSPDASPHRARPSSTSS